MKKIPKVEINHILELRDSYPFDYGLDQTIKDDINHKKGGANASKSR